MARPRDRQRLADGAAAGPVTDAHAVKPSEVGTPMDPGNFAPMAHARGPFHDWKGPLSWCTRRDSNP